VTLTFDPAIRHTVVHHSSTSTYIPNFIQIEETFCGRTDGRTFFPSILLGRLSVVDLKIPLLQNPVHDKLQSVGKYQGNECMVLITSNLAISNRSWLSIIKETGIQP